MMNRIVSRLIQNQAAAFRQASARFGRQTLRNRRYQSTESDASSTVKQSFFQRSWNSPIGLKTVHFWAPVMKWVLVIAGLSDLSRPADKLSVTQNVALMCTGAIWTRWCLIIKPRNVLLASVNFFVGCLGLTQVTRIFLHRRQVDGSAAAAIKDITHEATSSTKDAVHHPENVTQRH